MRIGSLFIFALLASAQLHAQTTWFVSTSGADGSAGTTVATAFATVNQAVAVASCGDSIYVLHGTYHEKVIAYRVCPDAQRIVIQGDVDGRPLIIGDSTATNKYAIGASGQGFTFRHLELTSPYPDSCTASNMVVAGSGDHMTFIDIIIRNAGYDGMKTTSDCETSNWANDWKVVDCQIVNNGLGCPSSIQNGDGIDFTNCHDCLITGTTIRDNRGHQLQIKLEARNVTVEHCRIEGKWMFQIGLPGGSPQCDPTALNADSVFFRHNIIIAKGDTSEFIFRLADVSHLVIENNTIVKDSISSANIGFICFGGCAGSSAWENTPRSPVLIRNNIFANMSFVPFYAGPDTTFYDPFGIAQAQVIADHNLFYDANGGYTVAPDGGASSLVADPFFCNYPNSFELHPESACIDAGDPAGPSDPDSTPNDIGALYYHIPCMVGFDTPAHTMRLFDVYPNPTSGLLNISFSGQVAKQHVILFNAMGMLLQQFEMTTSAQIEISHLPSGLYSIHLLGPQPRSRKFIKL